MPQLDSLVLLSQTQLLLFFFVGYFIFIYKIIPFFFVYCSISNEFLVYKYWKHQYDHNIMSKAINGNHRSYFFCLMFVSNLEKYNQLKLHFYIEY